jgi:hypothetical protein
MTTGQTVQTIFEIIMVGFLIWGAFHEDVLARFEKKIINKLMKKLKGGENCETNHF